MADDPASGGSDPLAAAKANLRDTVKWLATTLAALAAVVIAGTSLTGLARLSGTNLWLALAGGAVAILAVLAVIALLLRLLMSEAFYFGDLFQPENADVLAELERHAIELLPPSIPTIAALGQVRQRAVEKVRDSVRTPAYDESVRYLDQLRPILVSVTYFGQFERMRQRLRRQRTWLFVLTAIGLAGLALLAVAVGRGSKATETAPPVTNIVYPPPTPGVPPTAAAPAEAARSSAIRILLTEAIRLNEKPGTAQGAPEATAHPILDLIHGLTEAGLMTGKEADSLTQEIRSEIIKGTGDVLVHAANNAVDHLFPPPTETTPSAAPPINISVSGCCGRCQATTPRRKTPLKRKKPGGCLRAPVAQKPAHAD